MNKQMRCTLFCSTVGRRHSSASSGGLLVGMAALLLSAPPLSGQPILEISARSVSMGGIASTITPRAEAMIQNPAGLALIHGYCGAAAYTRPFGIAQLATHSIMMAMPVSALKTGFLWQSFGFSQYREQRFLATGALAVAPGTWLGAGMRARRVSIQGYGSRTVFTVNAGAGVMLGERLAWSGSVLSVNRPKVGEGGPETSPIYLTAISTRLEERLLVVAGFSKELHFPTDLQTGFEFAPAPRVALRGGTGTSPRRLTAGLGLEVAGFELAYALTTHYELGLSHFFTVYFRRGGGQE